MLKVVPRTRAASAAATEDAPAATQAPRPAPARFGPGHAGGMPAPRRRRADDEPGGRADS